VHSELEAQATTCSVGAQVFDQPLVDLGDLVRIVAQDGMGGWRTPLRVTSILRPPAKLCRQPLLVSTETTPSIGW
jgi:hypothetical protein